MHLSTGRRPLQELKTKYYFKKEKQIRTIFSETRGITMHVFPRSESPKASKKKEKSKKKKKEKKHKKAEANSSDTDSSEASDDSR